jgi:hypothetical protein
MFDIYKLLLYTYRSVNAAWHCPSIAFVSFWCPLVSIYGDILWLMVFATIIIRYAYQAILLVGTKRLYKGHRARLKFRDRCADTCAPGRSRFICAVILWQAVLAQELVNVW